MRALFLILAFLYTAASAQTRGGALYGSPTKAWQGALGPTAAGLTPASYGPLVHQLQSALKLDPMTFSRLAATEKLAALDLAAEEARAEVQRKGFELAALAETFSASESDLDEESRERLYWTVAQLDELQRYGPLLGDAAETAAASYKKASARAWNVRSRLLEEKIGQTAAQFVPAANNNHLKLLEKMRNNSHGWMLNDLDTLLSAWGFQHRNGAKHNVYNHPRFPDLRLTIPHDRRAPAVYVDDAVALVDEIQRRVSPKTKKNSAPPERIQPGDLAILLGPKS
jgi:hypothetical protein